MHFSLARLFAICWVNDFMNVLRTIGAAVPMLLAALVLFADPGVEHYSAIAVTVFVVLLGTSMARRTLLQPFNLFCVIFFFYNFTSHFLFEFSGLSVLGALHSDANRDRVVRQALIGYCVLVACTQLFGHGAGTSSLAVRTYMSEMSAKLAPARLLLLALATLLVALAVFAPVLPVVLQGGLIDRVRSSNYINSDLWVFVGLFCYAGSVLSIICMKRSRTVSLLALACFGSYFVLDMMIGGRKVLFYLILTLLPMVGATKGFRAKYLAYGAVAVLLPVTMRALIDKVDLIERDIAGIVAGIFGEFLFTSGTGYIMDAHYQAICGEAGISSYFYWLIYLIPRAIYDSKPYSMAYEFAMYMDMGMGFALTPVAEAYCVSSEQAWLALVVSTVVLFAAIAWFSRRSAIVYLIAIALAMDFNRGEFSYSVIQVATIYAIFRLFAFVATPSKGDEGSGEEPQHIIKGTARG